MNLCDPTPEPNATDLANMYYTAISTYQYAPQFNYPYTTTFGVRTVVVLSICIVVAESLWQEAYPFDYLINQTLNASTPGQVLQLPMAMTNWQSPSACLDWSSANITHKTDIDVSMAWFYLQCQYYPISENAIPSGNLLPPLKATGRDRHVRLPRVREQYLQPDKRVLARLPWNFDRNH